MKETVAIIVKEEVVPVLDSALKESILPKLELRIEKLIEEKSDAVVDMLLGKMAALIPGKLDDAFIAARAPELKAAAKAYLLGYAEKISDKV